MTLNSLNSNLQWVDVEIAAMLASCSMSRRELMRNTTLRARAWYIIISHILLYIHTAIWPYSYTAHLFPGREAQILKSKNSVRMAEWGESPLCVSRVGVQIQEARPLVRLWDLHPLSRLSESVGVRAPLGWGGGPHNPSAYMECKRVHVFSEPRCEDKGLFNCAFIPSMWLQITCIYSKRAFPSKQGDQII